MSPPDGFSDTDSPAIAGSLDGELEEGPESQAGPHVPDAEDGVVAGKAYPRKGGVWPASFIVTNIRGLVGVRGRNKSPFLHDLASQRNCLWVAVTESWLRPDILDSELACIINHLEKLRELKLYDCNKITGIFNPIHV